MVIVIHSNAELLVELGKVAGPGTWEPRRDRVSTELMLEARLLEIEPQI